MAVKNPSNFIGYCTEIKLSCQILYFFMYIIVRHHLSQYLLSDRFLDASYTTYLYLYIKLLRCHLSMLFYVTILVRILKNWTYKNETSIVITVKNLI